MDPTTETAPHGFITLVSRGEDRESITTRQSEKTRAPQLASPPAAARRRGERSKDVLPHRAGAEHAAAPAALRPAPPGQARLQAHQGRRGHLQVGFSPPDA